MYAIYQELADSHQIKLMETYRTYSEANFHLNQIVMNYLESTRADHSQEIIMMGLEGPISEETDLSRPEVAPGYYLKLSKIYPNRIHVYRKSRKLVPGYLWNGEAFEVKETMWFGILELKAKSNLTHHDFEATNQKEVSQSFKHHGGQVRLIEELKEAVGRRQTSLALDETGNLSDIRPKIPGNDFVESLTNYIRKKMPQLVNGEFAKGESPELEVTESAEFENTKSLEIESIEYLESDSSDSEVEYVGDPIRINFITDNI